MQARSQNGDLRLESGPVARLVEVSMGIGVHGMRRRDGDDEKKLAGRFSGSIGARFEGSDCSERPARANGSVTKCGKQRAEEPKPQCLTNSFSVWVTSADGRFATAPKIEWRLTQRASAAAEHIQRGPSRKFQQILGFGGAFTDAAPVPLKANSVTTLLWSGYGA
jgi:hypothetical protein